MKQFTAVVLAAGKGKRMKSSCPKVLHDLMGKPLIYYVLRELLSIKKHIKQIVIVVGYKGKEIECKVKKYFPKKNLKFVYQKKLLGTADAVRAASRKITNSNVLILCGDAPLITAETLSSFISFYFKKKLDYCVLTANTQKETSLGVILRDGCGKLQAIKERIDIGSSIVSCEINSGIYCFKGKPLLEGLSKITRNKKKKEYFLTDIVEILYKKGLKPDCYALNCYEEILGINTQKDLLAASKIMRQRVLNELIERGIKVIDPENTFIEEGVRIGKNTIIYPFTFIERNVIIGSNCSVGPFIRLRCGTHLEDNAQVGNFLEITRSKIGKGTKIKHFGYLGDTVIEDNVNIGAGVVVANFNGKAKNKTYIKKNSFIGSDTVLVAPITVGEGAVTGAGSVVNKNVKRNTVVAGVPAKLLKEKK